MGDNGTGDHPWQFYLLKDGNYLVQNVSSSLYLEDTIATVGAPTLGINWLGFDSGGWPFVQ